MLFVQRCAETVFRELSHVRVSLSEVNVLRVPIYVICLLLALIAPQPFCR